MSLPMQHIIQHLFNTASLSSVPREQLEELVEEYPSFGVARYLLSRKLHAEGDEHFSEETLKTNLYFSNPYWLQWLLKNNGDDPMAGAMEMRRGTTTPARGPGYVVKEKKEELASAEEEIPETTASVSEPLYGSAEEARAAAAEELRMHADEAARREGQQGGSEIDRPAEDLVTGSESVATEEPVEGYENIAAEGQVEGSEDVATEGAGTAVEDIAVEGTAAGPEEAAPAEGPSAADQLLESIAALRLSHQQATEEVPAVPDEEAPAMSIAAMTLEQADDHSFEDSDGTPPLPEDSEESASAVIAAAGYPDGNGVEADSPAISVQGMEGGAVGEGQAAGPAVESAAGPVNEAAADQPATGSGGPVISTIIEPVVAFEPFHTIDYFASQGIKLSLDENPSDKLGKQLKSFTDWLKVMRKLPQQNSQIVPDIAAEHQVRASAAHSIEGKEVVTETMAEVLVKQGMREKAMEVYRKLSLLDPDKSAYFANKIEELKID